MHWFNHAHFSVWRHHWHQQGGIQSTLLLIHDYICKWFKPNTFLKCSFSKLTLEYTFPCIPWTGSQSVQSVHRTPITQNSQLFYNHDSHLIENMIENHFNPKKSHTPICFSQHWLNHARYGGWEYIRGCPSLRVAIVLYIEADIRPSGHHWPRAQRAMSIITLI